METRWYGYLRRRKRRNQWQRGRLRVSGKKFYALGRLKTGEMNKTESAYSAHLEMLRIAGELAWHKFEGLKLRLADNTFLTVDFFVMTSTGELQAHDVKGFMTDDANVKMKVAADMYPFRFFVVRAKAKKNGGGWDIREVSA
jgi:hypothetical protein